MYFLFFFFQAEDGIRDKLVTGVQTCALPISGPHARASGSSPPPTRSGTSGPPSGSCGRRCRRRARGVSHPEPRNAFVPPWWGRIATFMLLPAVATAEGLDVALVGIPYDGGVSYRTGARFGPRAVREQSSLIRPWHPVLKVHPFERLRVADCGDVDVAPISIERTYAAIERRVNEILAHGAVPVSVGGDHSVTLPILRSLARRLGPLGLVHFDAHPDTWDEYFGSKRSEEHTSELQSLAYLVCRLLLEKKKKKQSTERSLRYQ